MEIETLETAIAEAKRFIKKADDLLLCTRLSSLTSTKERNFKKYGHDEGLHSSQSKRVASVKRSCIDLKNSLSDITQGR